MASIGQNLIISRIPEGTFRNAERLRWDGENLSFSGRIEPTTTAALPRIREQILGLNNTVDTPVIPIECDAEATLDGYYTQPRATVTYAPGDAALGHFDYTFEARRVPGRDIPRMELLTLGGLRANDHSYAAGACVPWVGIPAAAVDAWDGEATAPPHAFDLTRKCSTATDDVGIYTYSTTGIAARLARFSIPPANFYDGAAALTIDGHNVTGRQLWTTDAATAAWSVGNGIVTVTPGATAGELTVTSLNTAGSATTAQNYSLTYYDSGTPLVIDAWTTLTVIRNTAELVVIRAGCRSGTRRELAALDITIRRGARTAEFTFRTENSTAKKVGISPTGAAGSATARINQTTGSHRWYILTPHTHTPDTTNGAITVTSSRMNFGIGHYDPSGGTGDTIAALEDQYFGVVEPWQLVVGR